VLTSSLSMAAPSDLEQQKDTQIYQTTAVTGNEQTRMTQDETALYVAGTLEVRVDFLILIPRRCSIPLAHISPTNFASKDTIELILLAPKTVSYPRDGDQGLQPSSCPGLHAWLCAIPDCWNVQCYYLPRWCRTADCISSGCCQHCFVYRLHSCLSRCSSLSELFWIAWYFML
jgi:hypothetical protein